MMPVQMDLDILCLLAGAFLICTSNAFAGTSTSVWVPHQSVENYGLRALATSFRRAGRRRRRGPGRCSSSRSAARSIPADIDVDVRMSGVKQTRDPQAQVRMHTNFIELRAAAAGTVRPHRDASCRREHRVDDDHVTVRHVVRKLLVVGDRLERLLVAVQTDVTDLRDGNHAEHAVDHAEAGTQDRPRRQPSCRSPDWPVIVVIGASICTASVSRSFVASYVRRFAISSTNCRNCSPGVALDTAQERQLVADQRVIDLDDLAGRGRRLNWERRWSCVSFFEV